MSTNEWYTPTRYLEGARAVMGGIELDVASCAEANLLVQATRYFTEQENGLLQAWWGRSVWCNPPYARTATYRSGIRAWVDKALQAYQGGAIGQAILLLTTEVNAAWFQPLYAYPICFPDHRVKFRAPKKDRRGIYSHMFGTCFVYLGPHTTLFAEVFGQFGAVGTFTRRVHAERVVTRSLWAEGDA